MTHICVSKLIGIGSDNGLLPERRQAIIWTNAGILLIGPLGTNFSENLLEIMTFSLKKICFKMSSAKCFSFRLGLNVLNDEGLYWHLSGHTQLTLNTLRPRQNGRRFADDTFKRIFLNENVRISIKISLKFVPKGPINNIPALVQIMAWRRPGDKPLSEPMLVR